ncbi:Uncharacterized protein OS=Singulisphaera acidiphila (strain ATCC BAA-1392 / DSM 18658 / VKM B-2454 / MOB10) GN=Sinac_5936 PE=4 SV=1: Peptidase_MA_2 [Gemmata massiliana]|uniref:Uncharacterized protein n=1 Tax=Gemmata massiliana TaxID=1210884 RepID=A0A6P2DBV8_9BACT|nr:hypothetical protein [Gemmata massiliana]VTR98716.1 Uncharacterized protein OS=Singulisphaera acidiphila (strain ATCC BAA-1392 / DSM 18658 / VKM B-2454 / MOB10) GN=Sinac_5936 PE=4 SV=1: Peptidase_MA_2 [Gemmata massiliana]
MLRFVLAFALTGIALAARFTVAADAQPDPIEKQLAVQQAMADARKYLDAASPAEAVAALEKEISNADGSKAFLTLLRECYTAELARLEKAPTAEAERIAQTRRKLSLLGGEAKPAPVPTPVAPAVPVMPPVPATLPEPNLGPSLVEPTVEPLAAPTIAPVGDSAASAVAAFKKGNYADAAQLFASVGGANLTVEQKAAWAYCRIKLSADRVNSPSCDAVTAASAVQDVTEALQLVPQNADLQKVGQQLLKAAQAKAGSAKAVAPVVSAAGDVVETDSFRVHHGGDRALGESVANAAEAGRKQIFERWSGAPGGAWQPKCDIVIHATGDVYAKATGKPAAMTGHASVSLTNKRATARRIDLRADDTAAVSNALPRELTHVVLADLFADKPPPKWAEEGMAILAGSPEEISRYTRTLPRCARDNELRNLAALFELKDFPAEKITGYYCQSVSVTEHLIKLKGERNFKIFLSDAERYGTPRALERQYGIQSVQTLEASWKSANLESARGQAP